MNINKLKANLESVKQDIAGYTWAVMQGMVDEGDAQEHLGHLNGEKESFERQIAEFEQSDVFYELHATNEKTGKSIMHFNEMLALIDQINKERAAGSKCKVFTNVRGA